MIIIQIIYIDDYDNDLTFHISSLKTSPLSRFSKGCEEHLLELTSAETRSNAGMMFAGMVTAMLALMSSGVWDAQ